MLSPDNFSIAFDSTDNVYIITVYFSLPGGEEAFQGRHFHDFKTRKDAEALLSRIRKAGITADHILDSKHWQGSIDWTYQGYCNQFAMGAIDEAGYATF